MFYFLAQKPQKNSSMVFIDEIFNFHVNTRENEMGLQMVITIIVIIIILNCLLLIALKTFPFVIKLEVHLEHYHCNDMGRSLLFLLSYCDV